MEIEVLNEERLRYWCSRIDIPGEAVEELVKIAQQIKGDEALLACFACFHQETALKGNWHMDWSPLPMDPRVEASMGERASQFYLLAYLADLPYLAREYERRGIAPVVFHDTLLDFRLWMEVYQEIHGFWGYDKFMWIWRHMVARLFRLGRLQYMLAEFEGGIHAFRNAVSGRILLLADPEQPLRADGYALGAGRVRGAGGPLDLPEPEIEEPSEEGWQPTFEARQDGWLGYPISPYGFARREKVFLPSQEWMLALQAGDDILDLHIPRGADFSVEACRDSLQQAYAFFPRQYPERPFKASFCHTWFFTPQLQQILPPESNIVHFQREFYLYPHAGGPGFLWEFVFGERYNKMAMAPRDSFLRRSVLEWLSKGGELFDLPGVRFHGPDAWGVQPYMSQPG